MLFANSNGERLVCPSCGSMWFDGVTIYYVECLEEECRWVGLKSDLVTREEFRRKKTEKRSRGIQHLNAKRISTIIL
jgi:hypothetical protein